MGTSLWEGGDPGLAELEQNSITLDALSARELEAIIQQIKGPPPPPPPPPRPEPAPPVVKQEEPPPPPPPEPEVKPPPPPEPEPVVQEPEPEPVVQEQEPEPEPELEKVELDLAEESFRDLLVVSEPEPEPEPEPEVTEEPAAVAQPEPPPPEPEPVAQEPAPPAEPLPDVEVQAIASVTDEELKRLEELAAAARKREEVEKDFTRFIGKIKINVSKALEEQSAGDKKAPKLERSRYASVLNVISKNEAVFGTTKKNVRYHPKPMTRAQQRDYLEKVDEQLRQLWKLPLEMDRNLVVLVSVVVARDGTLVRHEFVQLSSNEFLNNSVRKIFQSVKKLVPLPEDFTGRYTEVGLKFRP